MCFRCSRRSPAISHSSSNVWWKLYWQVMKLDLLWRNKLFCWSSWTTVSTVWCVPLHWYPFVTLGILCCCLSDQFSVINSCYTDLFKKVCIAYCRIMKAKSSHGYIAFFSIFQFHIYCIIKSGLLELARVFRFRQQDNFILDNKMIKMLSLR